MDPDLAHILKGIAIFLVGLYGKSVLINDAGYLVHIVDILILILVVYKYLLSCKLAPVRGGDNFTTLIVGAGFSGLGMAIKLNEMGVKYRIVEKSDRLGGTWRDNVYPGCGCDVPSHLYSFSFYMNPNWTRGYAGQEEILEHMEQLASDHDLTSKIEFGKDIVKMVWNPTTHKWHSETSTGEVIITNAVVSAIGGLHVPNVPTFEGQDVFKGDAFHSARWKKDYDPTGRTVAVIGTGASAVQVAPSIAPKVKHLKVFQRTPCWTGPKDDMSYPVWLRKLFSIYPPAMYLLRLFYFWRSEIIFFLIIRTNSKLKNIGKRLLTKHIKKTVNDPELAKKLIPNYEVGCKRITPSNSYLQAYNRNNVSLVTDTIKRFTEDGIETVDGTVHKVDTIIYATGFSLANHQRSREVLVPVNGSARTPDQTVHQNGSLSNGAMQKKSVQSNEYKSLIELWGDTPNAYLGITSPGFPNLFFILGPGTGLGVGSLMLNLESQFSYISQSIRHIIEKGIRSIEVKKEVNDAYQSWARTTIKNKAFAHDSCTSWYRNAQGITYTMWATQPFLYWWHTLRMNPEEFICK